MLQESKMFCFSLFCSIYFIATVRTFARNNSALKLHLHIFVRAAIELQDCCSIYFIATVRTFARNNSALKLHLHIFVCAAIELQDCCSIYFFIAQETTNFQLRFLHGGPHDVLARNRKSGFNTYTMRSNKFLRSIINATVNPVF